MFIVLWNIFYSEEDQRFQESTISQRRQEALQKAEERQQQHSATLMQKQAEEIKQKRCRIKVDPIAQ